VLLLGVIASLPIDRRPDVRAGQLVN
jgi:hypothetical protein